MECLYPKREISSTLTPPPSSPVTNEGSFFWVGSNCKPPYSYANLIAEAICSSPDGKMTLNGIYNYISEKYPYYQKSKQGWQVASWRLIEEFYPT